MSHRLIVANWKMHGDRAFAQKLITDVKVAVHEDVTANVYDVVFCVPDTLLAFAAEQCTGMPIGVGGQDCHTQESGAYTGDTSAVMLKDAGAEYVIVGHSERRVQHSEDNEMVRQKSIAALSAGLSPIICVGETNEERQKGQAKDVVARQIRQSCPPWDSSEAKSKELVIAYEPVWAIGTGLVPTLTNIDEMHNCIRDVLREIYKHADTIRILYGGSLKPENASGIFSLSSVDGGLIGGASLKSESFNGICVQARLAT